MTSAVNNPFTAETAVDIDAPPRQVWKALTTPAIIKRYLYGTDVTSDWREGASITYQGLWHGRRYEDRGILLRVEPEKRLVSTFWSSLSGLPDVPANRKTVHYELSPRGRGTHLALIQEGNRTPEEAVHAEENWASILEELKSILEE